MHRLSTWLREVDDWWFDLDGTLVQSMPYRTLLQRVAKLLNIPYTNELYHYRNSWVDVPTAHARHLTMADNGGTRDQIDRIYQKYSADNKTPSVITGAFPCVEGLLACNKRLICYTRGNQEWQMGKILVTGLRRVFSEVCVVQSKDVATLQGHVARISPDQPFIMIGNTFNEDIAPAAGIARGRIYTSSAATASLRDTPGQLSDDILVVDTVADLVPEITRHKESLS